MASSIVLVVLAAEAAALTMDTVLVGNPGNGPDQHGGRHGTVSYVYRIGQYEVTNSQYTEFLNAVDPMGTNELGLYNPEMGSDARGGILLDLGNPNGSKYEVKSGRAKNPVVLVAWYDTLRFVNWLHNGQGAGDTEDGAYTLLGGTAVPSNGTTITRSPDARWFLPSEDEWYKAAYHQPRSQGGDSDDYWLYPTGTNDPPIAVPPPGSTAENASNTANFGVDRGAPDFDNSHNYLTDVGAYSDSVSYYGTFDQAGNVWEWNEENDPILASHRVVRGGSWSRLLLHLAASSSTLEFAASEQMNQGFRVASIPEPSTFVLLLLGVFGNLTIVRRRQHWPAAVRRR